jgi:hypothetical protein
MKSETTPDSNANQTETDTEVLADKQPEAESKLLLGKRVLRHFGVRSDVQAGTNSIRVRCF